MHYGPSKFVLSLDPRDCSTLVDPDNTGAPLGLSVGRAAHPIRPIDLCARPIRVKWALTDRHGKSDLPCPRWLPPRPPHRRASRRRRVVGHGRNGAYGMSSADPVGDNGKAGADGIDGRAWTPMAQTGMWTRTEGAGMGIWAQTFRAGTGMWARTLRRV
jgi:hypothetical protein